MAKGFSCHMQASEEMNLYVIQMNPVVIVKAAALR
jgi:hypothetical protein